MKKQFSFPLWLCVFASALLFNACSSSQDSKEYRGIVLYPSDILSVGVDTWLKFLEEADLNLIGLHADSYHEPIAHLKAFWESSEGEAFVAGCAARGIEVEFELHLLQDLLPRALFQEHPDYFRMDSCGARQQAYNICFSSEAAYTEIEKQLKELLSWIKPTTHRYLIWTDDVEGAFCHCPACKNYSDSEQALLFENRLLAMIRKTDPKATVAHLAYQNTLSAPVRVKPAKGIFLEYAPIKRDYDLPLSPTHRAALAANLQVFPAETAHVLEYWIDASLFARWKKEHPVRIPWKSENCRRDVEAYKAFGISSITSFGAWINARYIEEFGIEHTEAVLSAYGAALNE